MKVLFALGSEQTSKRVAEKYLEKYGEEMEYKNVFYFKALLDEVKKDKSYDRIVISEELEQFGLKNVEAFDKFIFNNVDNVTDEVEDCEIIFICSDRRSRDHDRFVERLFNIGVYNTLIGDERNVTSLCEFIKNPMNKKEAKRHLNINPIVSDGTMSTRDDEVEEAQIMSILKYYDSIKGKSEEYLPAFDRIAEQYSRNQLKVIINFLPADVKKEILSSERYIFLIDSNEYQNLQNSNNTQNTINKPGKRGLLFGILKDNKSKETFRKQSASGSTINGNGSDEAIKLQETLKMESDKLREEEEAIKKAEEELRKKEEMNKKAEQEAKEREKMQSDIQNTNTVQSDFEKQQAELKKLAEQQALQREQTIEQTNVNQDALAKQQEELQKKAQQEAFEKAKEEQRRKVAQEAMEYVDKTEQEKLEEERKKIEQEKIALEEARKKLREQSVQYAPTIPRMKKMIVLAGANKSGTTFLANAIAHNLTSSNINVGLLDMAKDTSLYYIYNQNDKALRNIASECMQKLGEGIDSYIPVNKNLKVYTSIPGAVESKRSYKNRAIIDTVREANDVLIVDGDFSTPSDYFEKAQEIYIVQDMDIIKMQDTTKFLRELKNRGIDMKKIRIIVNKYVKCLLTPKKMVEGLSYYNDPQMSFIDELLDSKVQYFMIPFSVENYARYVDCIYKNNMDYKKFTPDFKEAIAELTNQMFRADSQPRKRGIFG